MDEVLVSAFAGAFLAFFFVRLGEYLNKLYERHRDHYNSFVLLQTELNRLHGILVDNTHLIPNFVNTIQNNKIYFNRLHELTLSDKHLEHLFNITLINELFDLHTDVTRLNSDMKNVDEMYSEVKQVFIQRLLQKQVNEGIEEYKINTEYITGNLKKLEEFTKKLQLKALKTLAVIRIKSCTDKPLFLVVSEKILKGLESYPSAEQIKSELVVMKQEIDENTNKNMQESSEISSS